MKVFLRYFMLTIFTLTFFASCATSSVCAKGCCKNKQAQTCAADCTKACCKK
jgi:hypothetical protein